MGKVEIMQTIWQFITLVHDAGASQGATGIEKTLQHRTGVVEDTQYVERLKYKGRLLSEGIELGEATQTILKERKRLSVHQEIVNGCVTPAQMRSNYPAIAVRFPPRGRSLEESTIWQIKTEKAQISFAFKESKPDCLHAVRIDFFHD